MDSPQHNDLHAVDHDDAHARLKLMRIGYQERRKSLETKIESLVGLPPSFSRPEDVEITDYAYRSLRKLHQRDATEEVANRLYADAKQRSITRHLVGMEEQHRVKQRAVPRVNPSKLRVDTGQENTGNRASVYERLFQQADQRRRRFAAKARAQRDARIRYDQEVDDEKRLGIEALHEHAERGAAMVKVRSPLFYASYHEKREKKLQAKRKQSEDGNCTFAPEINAYSAKLVQRSRLRREPLYERLFRMGMRSNKAATQRPRAQSDMGGEFTPAYEIRPRNISSPPPPSHFLNAPFGADAKPSHEETQETVETAAKTLNKIDEEHESIRPDLEQKEDVEESNADSHSEDRKALHRQNARGVSGTELEASEGEPAIAAKESVVVEEEDSKSSSIEEEEEGKEESEADLLGMYKRENVQAWKHGAFGHPHKALLTVDLRALFWTSKDGSLNFITWEEVLMALPALVRNKPKRRQVSGLSQVLKFRRPGPAASKEIRYYISIVAKKDRKPLVLSFLQEAEREDFLQAITGILDKRNVSPKPSPRSRRRSSMPPAQLNLHELSGIAQERERGQSAAAC